MIVSLTDQTPPAQNRHSSTYVYLLRCLVCGRGYYTDMPQAPHCPACYTARLGLVAVWDLQAAPAHNEV